METSTKVVEIDCGTNSLRLYFECAFSKDSRAFHACGLF